MNQKILITGASGLIGTRLTQLLKEKSYEVVHLSRSGKEEGVKTYVWDIDHHRIDATALEGVTTIIHLAGAGIADKPWTEKRKRKILESRTHSTRLLFDTLKNGRHQVKNFISASAIGYYGFEDNEKLFHEEDAPGKDFLAQVVTKWEQEVDAIADLGVRVVKIRVGIVLSTEGGALRELIKPVKYGVGAPLGSGEQQMSWIHLDDLCKIFMKAHEDGSMQGAYNGVAPHPVSNREFTKAIARALGRPILFPAVPGFVLKLLLGEMAELVLKGNRISSSKVENAGHAFTFPTLERAVADLLHK